MTTTVYEASIYSLELLLRREQNKTISNNTKIIHIP